MGIYLVSGDIMWLHLQTHSVVPTFLVLLPSFWLKAQCVRFTGLYWYEMQMHTYVFSLTVTKNKRLLCFHSQIISIYVYTKSRFPL